MRRLPLPHTPDTAMTLVDALNHVLKYNHDVFQQTIHDAPDDRHTPAVYGDYVEEQAGPAHREFIDRVVEHRGKPGPEGLGVAARVWATTSNYEGQPPAPSGFHVHGYQSSLSDRDGRWSIDLGSRRSGEGPSYRWTLNFLHPEEVQRIVRGLHGEGAHVGPSLSHFLKDAEPTPDEVNHNATKL